MENHSIGDPSFFFFGCPNYTRSSKVDGFQGLHLNSWNVRLVTGKPAQISFCLSRSLTPKGSQSTAIPCCIEYVLPYQPDMLSSVRSSSSATNSSLSHRLLNSLEALFVLQRSWNTNSSSSAQHICVQDQRVQDHCSLNLKYMLAPDIIEFMCSMNLQLRVWLTKAARKLVILSAYMVFSFDDLATENWGEIRWNGS